ncbi:MAG: type II toxin-antitoxin system HicA family toxin [Pseudomonadota bacterium]
MRAHKTGKKIAAGSRNIAVDDFQRLVEAFGLVHRRTTGSHRILSQPRVPRPLGLQPRHGEVKPYQVSQFLEMVEEFGWTMEEGR